MERFEMTLPLLPPIGQLILDDSISEVVGNSPDHLFIEMKLL